MCATGLSLAYWDNYPPYKFKSNRLPYLNVKPLVMNNKDYKSKDGSVAVHLSEPKLFEVEFFLKVNNIILASSDQKINGFPCAVFQADLDNNGLDDFIMVYNYRGSGLAAHQDRVELYLRKDKDSFERVSYDTFDAGLDDFIGPDKGGRCKVIITGFYQGDKHNYISYNIYEFKNYRLVNADAKVKGFPKFIRYTNMPNDEDTVRLNVKERLLHSQEKGSSISYKEIR